MRSMEGTGGGSWHASEVLSKNNAGRVVAVAQAKAVNHTEELQRTD